MKRIYGIITAVAALGVSAYLGTSLWAQQPGPTGAPPAAAQVATPRVAVVNMYNVLKNYKKWEYYRDEMQKLAKVYEERAMGWKIAIDKETANLKQPTLTPAQRDESQAKIKKWTREAEDNSMIAQKELGDKGEAQLVQIYKEVEDAVKSYSVSYGIHVVLSYNDLEAGELYSGRNIQRKLAAGAYPMYIAPGMDISSAITSMLNSRYSPAAAAASSGPASAPQPGRQ